MKFLCFVAFTATFLLSASALKCWTCTNAKTNEECNTQGVLKNCLANQQACQNEVRTVGIQNFLITKNCKQAEACDNNFIQNMRPAWYPTQCNIKSPSTVCRCCCNTDGCNAPMLGCLGSCSARVNPIHGRVVCSDGNNDLSSCTYSCSPGYLLVGEISSTCNVIDDVASWSAPPPICQPTQCPPQIPPTNGGVSCTNGDDVGSTCTYTCDPSYVMIGPDTTLCQDDLTWSNPVATCILVVCLPPQENSLVNGNVDCSDGDLLSSVCSYSCSDGYNLVGDITRTCVADSTGIAGEWTGTSPECVPDVCLPPLEAPDNGNVVCTDSNNYLSECTFTCADGYGLSSPGVLRCRYFEGAVDWAPQTVPTCIRITCEPPAPEPADGSVVCTNENFENSVCTYSCNNGYVVQGGSEVTCLFTTSTSTLGRWDRAFPTCAPITCQPEQEAPANGTVDCTNSNFMDSVCTFTCNLAHALVGSPATTCLSAGDDQPIGIWSDNTPRTCVAIRCNPEQVAPANGSVQCSNGNYLGSACEFSCNAGYSPNGITTMVCEDDGNSDPLGEWSSPNPPTCDAIVCVPPQSDPANGDVSCTNENFLDSACTFSCNPGYILDGLDTTTCVLVGDNPLWDLPAPSCIVETCFVIANPQNGVVTCTNANNDLSVCDFECDPGHILVGNSQTVCRDFGGTGRWDAAFPICEALFCPAQEAPENGGFSCTDDNNVGSVCSFSCLPGYSLTGASSTTCQNDQTWSNPRPTCHAIVCLPAQGAILNGNVSCSDGNGLTSVCSFSCVDGYVLVGDSTRECELSDGGDIGEWTGERPTCEPDVCLPPLEAPDNGDVVCTDSNNYLSECTFTCADGYGLSSPGVLRCRYFEGAVDWAPQTVPTCIRITCEPPAPAPADGSVVCTNENFENSVCTYSCNDGYVVQGGSEVTCLFTTSTSTLGRWDREFPTCAQINCQPEQVAPLNGGVSCTNLNNNGSVCTFGCDRGFAVIGASVLTCDEDSTNVPTYGTWSDDSPTCTAITCIPEQQDPANGTVFCTNDNLMDSICSFACVQTHALVGPSFTICNPNENAGPIGVWSNPEPPVCLPIFCQPPQENPVNGQVTCTNGNLIFSTCEYSCSAGFGLVGESTTVCTYDGNSELIGIWSNPTPPTCEDV